MFLAFASALAIAQLSGPATIQEDRLSACLEVARTDPATAINDANEWLEGLSGPERSYPEQCLGFAYMSLLRWDAAQDAFLRSRNALASGDFTTRARIGAMAGNAAMVAGGNDAALALFASAHQDALAGEDNELAGTISSMRARAFVALEQLPEAAGELEDARNRAPQQAEVWLLSATLARRMDDLAMAQEWIGIAGALDSEDPAIGLEAGLIAAMGGFDEAARASWQSVMDLAPQSPQADAARQYLAQLDEMTAAQ